MRKLRPIGCNVHSMLCWLHMSEAVSHQRSAVSIVAVERQVGRQREYLKDFTLWMAES